jgi:hypothetical protein
MSKIKNELISTLFLALSFKFTFLKAIEDIFAYSWRTNAYSGTGKESYDLYSCSYGERSGRFRRNSN